MASSKRLRVLSLDGGGVTALSSLRILNRIFRLIQDAEKLNDMPLPCNYFDLIGGTSMGGLIAIMLGPLKMSISESIEVFIELSSKVSGEGKSPGILSKLARAKKGYADPNRQSLEDAVEDTVKTLLRNKGFGEGMKLRHSTSACKIIVRVHGEPPARILDVARAAVGPSLMRRSSNNLVSEIVQEASAAFPGAEVGCLLSIGTGLTAFRLDQIDDQIPDAEDEWQKFAKGPQGKELYLAGNSFRLNVNRGISNVAPEDWGKIRDVIVYTEKYLGEVRTEIDVKACAIKLSELAVS